MKGKDDFIAEIQALVGKEWDAITLPTDYTSLLDLYGYSFTYEDHAAPAGMLRTLTATKAGGRTLRETMVIAPPNYPQATSAHHTAMLLETILKDAQPYPHEVMTAYFRQLAAVPSLSLDEVAATFNLGPVPA